MLGCLLQNLRELGSTTGSDGHLLLIKNIFEGARLQLLVATAELAEAMLGSFCLVEIRIRPSLRASAQPRDTCRGRVMAEVLLHFTDLATLFFKLSLEIHIVVMLYSEVA